MIDFLEVAYAGRLAVSFLFFFFLLHSANLFVLTTITYLCIRPSHITFTAGGTDEFTIGKL